MLKGKILQPRILYPAILSFRIEGEVKNFSDKQNLKEFINTKPTLKEMLKGLLDMETTNQTNVFNKTETDSQI